jgi:hypothetical protein
MRAGYPARDMTGLAADQADAVVRRIIAARAPLVWRDERVPDLDLGTGGLGLDSVSMVELRVTSDDLAVSLTPAG